MALECKKFNDAADKLFAAGKYMEAMSWWQKSVDIDPTDGAAYIGLCRAIVQLTFDVDAIENRRETTYHPYQMSMSGVEEDFRRHIEGLPQYLETTSNYLMAQNYASDEMLAQLDQDMADKAVELRAGFADYQTKVSQQIQTRRRSSSRTTQAVFSAVFTWIAIFLVFAIIGGLLNGFLIAAFIVGVSGIVVASIAARKVFVNVKYRQ